MSTRKWNFLKLSKEVFKDNETCMEWLMENGLLPQSRNCPNCKKTMLIDITTHGHGMGRFRCSRKHSSGQNIEIQITKKTFFENCKVSPIKAVVLMYCFATKMSYDQAIRETSEEEEETSRETIADWYSYFREICMNALDRTYDNTKIGGEGHVVEIDECKIGRRKYNRGRMIDGHWILGMIDREGDFRLEICPQNKRDKETLEFLIKKHVAPGTTIITDCWKGYCGLTEQGFKHFTVNHKYNFVDPETGANTQKIESNWRPFKKRLNRGGIKDEHLAAHLCEYLWRKEKTDQKGDPFSSLISDIKKMFPL